MSALSLKHSFVVLATGLAMAGPGTAQTQAQAPPPVHTQTQTKGALAVNAAKYFTHSGSLDRMVMQGIADDIRRARQPIAVADAEKLYTDLKSVPARMKQAGVRHGRYFDSALQQSTGLQWNDYLQSLRRAADVHIAELYRRSKDLSMTPRQRLDAMNQFQDVMYDTSLPSEKIYARFGSSNEAFSAEWNDLDYAADILDAEDPANAGLAALKALRSASIGTSKNRDHDKIKVLISAHIDHAMRNGIMQIMNPESDPLKAMNFIWNGLDDINYSATLQKLPSPNIDDFLRDMNITVADFEVALFGTAQRAAYKSADNAKTLQGARAINSIITLDALLASLTQSRSVKDIPQDRFAEMLESVGLSVSERQDILRRGAIYVAESALTWANDPDLKIENMNIFMERFTKLMNTLNYADFDLKNPEDRAIVESFDRRFQETVAKVYISYAQHLFDTALTMNRPAVFSYSGLENTEEFLRRGYNDRDLTRTVPQGLGIPYKTYHAIRGEILAPALRESYTNMLAEPLSEDGFIINDLRFIEQGVQYHYGKSIHQPEGQAILEEHGISYQTVMRLRLEHSVFALRQRWDEHLRLRGEEQNEKNKNDSYSALSAFAHQLTWSCRGIEDACLAPFGMNWQTLDRYLGAFRAYAYSQREGPRPPLPSEAPATPAPEPVTLKTTTSRDPVPTPK